MSNNNKSIPTMDSLDRFIAAKPKQTKIVAKKNTSKPISKKNKK